MNKKGGLGEFFNAFLFSVLISFGGISVDSYAGGFDDWAISPVEKPPRKISPKPPRKASPKPPRKTPQKQLQKTSPKLPRKASPKPPRKTPQKQPRKTSPKLPRTTSCRASFSETGYSRLCWLFDEGKGRAAWHMSGKPGRGGYVGDYYYANTWNYGRGAADLGRNVRSGCAGTVIYAQDTGKGHGKQVIVQARKNTDFAVRYSHLDKIHVKTGQSVAVGTLLGTVGDSGLPPNRCNAAGGWICPQLYLVVHKNINKTARYSRTALSWLRKGRAPLRVRVPRPTAFAAKFKVDNPR